MHIQVAKLGIGLRQAIARVSGGLDASTLHLGEHGSGGGFGLDASRVSRRWLAEGLPLGAALVEHPVQELVGFIRAEAEGRGYSTTLGMSVIVKVLLAGH
jgi:hypothetical protein